MPWHVNAWRAVARFNDEAPVTPPAVRRVLDQLRGVTWDPEAGFATVWRRAAVYPWLFLFVTKAAAAAAFFGYARLGATTIPVVALLVALALERFWPAGSDPRRRRAAGMALALMVAVEAARCLHRPGLALDGLPAGPQDPVPHADHLDHELVITLGSAAR